MKTISWVNRVFGLITLCCQEFYFKIYKQHVYIYGDCIEIFEFGFDGDIYKKVENPWSCKDFKKQNETTKIV